MPRQVKLKVFRTAIGFHDAYVAAPSQKAAMEAWGSDRDLFARGEAELVTDPELTAEPLASPGKVVKRLRGTAAEHIAALPAEEKHGGRQRPRLAEAKRPIEAKKRPAKARARPAPRPSRAALDAAEQEVEAAKTRHRAELGELAQREAALERERKALIKAQKVEASRLERDRQRRASAYEAAIRKWRG